MTEWLGVGRDGIAPTGSGDDPDDEPSDGEDDEPPTASSTKWLPVITITTTVNTG